MADAAERLLAAFERLDDRGRASLLDYAEFLVERHGVATAETPPLAEPNPLPRPEGESVVMAIKRLSAGYPMLDRSSMFHRTSALMTEHIMQGRPADEVIDDLERLFAEAYQKLKNTEQR